MRFEGWDVGVVVCLKRHVAAASVMHRSTVDSEKTEFLGVYNVEVP